VREARFRALVQNSFDVISVIDVGGTVRFVSPAVEQLFGWTPEEVVDTPLLVVVHHDDIDTMTAFLERCQAGNGAVGDHDSLRALTHVASIEGERTWGPKCN
jgi:PAS domain S-box-containing protein